jgi:hypothetical protein
LRCCEKYEKLNDRITKSRIRKRNADIALDKVYDYVSLSELRTEPEYKES